MTDPRAFPHPEDSLPRPLVGRASGGLTILGLCAQPLAAWFTHRLGTLGSGPWSAEGAQARAGDK